MSEPASRKPDVDVPASERRGHSGDDTRTMDLPNGVRKIEEAPQRLAKGTRVGRFIVLDELGEGGMGVVYAGLDVELERRVALKFLHPRGASNPGTDSPPSSSRLLREAQALARLSHPNVVGVYDVGSFGDQVFIAMELVEGQSLSEWLREAAREWPEIVDVFCAAGSGLSAAHNAGLVHRDFKPSNVLFRKDGRVAVMDFGLARRRTSRRSGPQASNEDAAPALTDEPGVSTQTSTLSGTPSYMAPEVFKGEQPEAAADQFAFCVALYEALFGMRPFPAVKPTDPTRWDLRPPRGTFNVPDSVYRVVLRGLSLDPAQRFPSMDALLDELRQAPARRTRRKVQRRNLLVLCGVILLGLPIDWVMSGIFRLDPFVVRATWGLAIGLMGLLVGAGRLTIGRAAIVVGAISPVAVALLTLDSGGSKSPFFRTFIMLPLFAVIVGPDLKGAVISTLTFSFLSAMVLHAVTGDGVGAYALTTLSFVGVAALCMHGVRHHRQIRDAERMADRGRIEALERLAAYERARTAEELKHTGSDEPSATATRKP